VSHSTARHRPCRRQLAAYSWCQAQYRAAELRNQHRPRDPRVSSKSSCCTVCMQTQAITHLTAAMGLVAESAHSQLVNSVVLPCAEGRRHCLAAWAFCICTMSVV
jgi:hypothetical protein